MRSITAVLSTLICALVLTASPASAQTKVKVFYTASASYMAPMIAKDQGFFKKRKLDVELTLGSTSYAMIAALLSDSAQIATVSTPSLVAALDNGLDLSALASTAAFPDPNLQIGLYARGGSSIKSARDLIGKTVGGAGIGGVMDVLYKKWLVEEKVDVKLIKNIEVPFAQHADLLKRGQIDAVVSAAPFAVLITESGNVKVADLTKGMPATSISGVFVATTAWANANPDAVKAFQEGLQEAIAFAQKNPDAARESMARYTKMKPELLGKIGIPALHARMDVHHLQYWVDLCRTQGLIKGKPDAAKHVAPWRATN